MNLTAAGEHEKGALERFTLVAKYSTHAETWSVVQTNYAKYDCAFEGGRNSFLKTMGFMDREGSWWLILHAFVHTDKFADEWLTKEIQECAEWSDANMWYGELV